MTVLPYFLFSWILLSVILFLQQASRFSDIFFSTTLPSVFVWQVAIALIPNVFSFTSPVALLIGGIIGLSKMQNDKELVVMRAAGLGNIQIAFPLGILGIILTFFAFFVNLYGVPYGAKVLRQVTLQTAIIKLESPIEPGVFNTEIKGFSVYVRTGNLERGSWEKIFIHQQADLNEEMRLITAKSGRIDTNEASKNAELVLEGASVTTVNLRDKKYAAESVRDFRLSISSKRNELIEKLKNVEKTTEEMGLGELGAYAATKAGAEKSEALILWQRRILLTLTPLIFGLLSSALIVKFRQGNLAFGIFLALAALIIYYLLALLGEQLARTALIPVYASLILPFSAGFLAIAYCFNSRKIFARKKHFDFSEKREKIKKIIIGFRGKSTPASIKSNIFDIDMIASLSKNFVLTVGLIGCIFIIFTAFELWKFAGTTPGGVHILFKYLIYLIPYVYIQVAPTGLLVAALATFIIKSRRREIVIWTSAGRSIYRILLPCFILMLLFGGINFLIQETLYPHANRTQDELRNNLRRRGAANTARGNLWTASEDRIFSYQLEAGENTDRQTKVKNFSMYEFDQEGNRLQYFLTADQAVLVDGAIQFPKGAKKLKLNDGKIETEEFSGTISEDYDPFKNRELTPTHMKINQIKDVIENANSEMLKRNYSVALEKRYSTIFLPFVILLFTAPFAISVGRKGNVLAVVYSLGLWLLFIGVGSVFEQLAANNMISPKIAVWSPIMLFAVIGMILISKSRT